MTSLHLRLVGSSQDPANAGLQAGEGPVEYTVRLTRDGISPGRMVLKNYAYSATQAPHLQGICVYFNWLDTGIQNSFTQFPHIYLPLDSHSRFTTVDLNQEMRCIFEEIPQESQVSVFFVQAGEHLTPRFIANGEFDLSLHFTFL